MLARGRTLNTARKLPVIAGLVGASTIEAANYVERDWVVIAVLSIAFVMAIVTSAVPRPTLFAVFSGLAKGLSPQKLAPFIDNMHTALWVLAATSLVGAGVCLLRPSHMSEAESATLSFEEHSASAPARERVGV